jgi:pyruvate ferredoxin oxidoreductase alpha subunit
LIAGKRAVAVIDQNLSLGSGGVLHTELAAALGLLSEPLPIVSFIAGLGGRDITPQEFFEMAAIMRWASMDGVLPQPRLLYTEAELREVRKLQTLAKVERDKLAGGEGDE